MSKDQWSTIPVVSDTANNTVVSVAHSSLYRMFVADVDKEGGITKDTVVSLFADDSDDDDLPGGRIDSRLSRESSERGRSALAEPLKSRAGRPVVV